MPWPTEMQLIRRRIEKGCPMTLAEVITYLTLRDEEIAEENQTIEQALRERLENERGTNDADNDTA